MVESGLAPRDTHVRLYEIPAVNKISGAPSITGSSGGTNKKEQEHMQVSELYTVSYFLTNTMILSLLNVCPLTFTLSPFRSLNSSSQEINKRTENLEDQN